MTANKNAMQDEAGRPQTRAERFVKKAMDRIDARHQAEVEARRSRRRGSSATQQARIDAAKAKRARKAAKRLVASSPSSEDRNSNNG